jgi:multiple sugar transport system ATP-binding protein
MAEVVLKDIRKVFDGGVEAVSSVNLRIPDGEFLVLVGPSGCGKSTTLNMIAGLETITSGTLMIGGRIVNDVPAKDRDIAMVFQNYALYPHMTVRKNMAFGLKLRKFPGQEIERRVDEAAEILGITDLLDRLPKALSGGQRQRVAVGRAIVRKPQVFLFDEPLSNLDAKLRVQMRVEISELHARLGTTMIYVTHDQTEAMTMGDRIVVMKDGVVQQIADPVTLYDTPANQFVAGFIGMPPMNFFSGTVTRDQGQLQFCEAQGISIDLPETFTQRLQGWEGRPVTLGVRPEDIGSAAAEMQRGQGVMRGRVRVIEPVGAESYLYVDSGQTTFTARVDSHKKFHVGELVELPTIVGHAHLFDSASGRSVV